MLLWFVAGSVCIIWFVFTDPNFDYRLLPVGAVAPAWIELAFRRATPLESLTVSALSLAAVMVFTRRSTRRRTLLMGLPLGMLLFLTLTGAWRTASVFFWPFFGWTLPDVANPIIARGWWNLPLELIGAIGCVWIWRRAGLANPERRREFVRSGKLHLPER